MKTGTGNKRVTNVLDRDKCPRWEGCGAEDQVTWGGAGVSLHIWFACDRIQDAMPGLVGHSVITVSLEAETESLSKLQSQFKTSPCKTKSKNTGPGLTGTALA